jgi:hypothetical protein
MLPKLMKHFFSTLKELSISSLIILEEHIKRLNDLLAGIGTDRSEGLRKFEQGVVECLIIEQQVVGVPFLFHDFLAEMVGLEL